MFGSQRKKQKYQNGDNFFENFANTAWSPQYMQMYGAMSNGAGLGAAAAHAQNWAFNRDMDEYDRYIQEQQLMRNNQYQDLQAANIMSQIDARNKTPISNGASTDAIRNYNFRNNLSSQTEKDQFDLTHRGFKIRNFNGVDNAVFPDGTTAPLNALEEQIAADTASQHAATKAEIDATHEATTAIEQPLADARLQVGLATLNDTEKLVDSMINHPGRERATGKSGIFPTIPGSQASDFEAKNTTLIARMAFQTLKDIKNSGATLGSVAEKELELLMNAAASLELTQSEDQYLQQLQYIKDGIARLKQGLSAQHEAQYGTSSQTGLKMGAIEDGYQFLGGDPSKPENWKKINE